LIAAERTGSAAPEPAPMAHAGAMRA